MKCLGLLAAVYLALTSCTIAAPIELRRGVGVHEWLNWSPLEADGTYRWPPYQSESAWLSGARPFEDWPDGNQFERIRAMGFDFVRLSVDPGPLVASAGVQRQEALAVLEAAVRAVTSAQLKVVFDLHAVSQVPRYGPDMIRDGADSAGVAAYREMVVEVARMLVRVGVNEVALEPYNEPAYYPCDASGTEDWQTIMADTVADIRTVSAALTIVATGACGGSITGLTDLDPWFDDPNLLYSFHMYEPHSFTHQRSDEPDGFASGLPWPASEGSPELTIERLRTYMDAAGIDTARQARNILELQSELAQYFAENWGQPQLEARLAEAVGWAEQHDIEPTRLFMGEFGAILVAPDGRRGAFDADRLRYLSAVRREAEKYGLPWAIWEYANPHGMSVIVPSGPAMPDGPLLQALGLESPQ